MGDRGGIAKVEIKDAELPLDNSLLSSSSCWSRPSFGYRWRSGATTLASGVDFFERLWPLTAVLVVRYRMSARRHLSLDPENTELFLWPRRRSVR